MYSMEEQQLVAALLVRCVALLLVARIAACAVAVAALGIVKGAALCAIVAGLALLLGRPQRFDDGE
jgi:hypothetical protein